MYSKKPIILRVYNISWFGDSHDDRDGHDGGNVVATKVTTLLLLRKTKNGHVLWCVLRWWSERHVRRTNDLIVGSHTEWTLVSNDPLTTIPSCFHTAADRFCHGLQCAMKTFNHTIGLRVVRWCADVLDFKSGRKSVEQLSFKLTTLVCWDDIQYAKTRYPVCDECDCYRVSWHVVDGPRLRPPSETVDTCNQVLVTFRWWAWSDDV